MKKSSNDCNDPNNEMNTNESQTTTNDDRPVVSNPNSSIECSPESVADKLNKTEPNAAAEVLERETLKPEAKKSYADLAKSGTDEWVDEMANRRGSMADKPKSRATLPRRNSRTGDRPTPNAGDRPNGECQFFIGIFSIQFIFFSLMNFLTISLNFCPHIKCTSDGYGRFSPKNDLLQVFVGNIPHTASEDDIRRIFSRFGRLVRCRFNSNTRKEWLPQYAFIQYENIQAVRQCLMKKVISNIFDFE